MRENLGLSKKKALTRLRLLLAAQAHLEAILMTEYEEALGLTRISSDAESMGGEYV